ncbi:hypothetical protein N177_0817 [Lutibaculum baratangense AMV1]|uniref:Uncharacterized protein n=1 Tax=Lutibaculum baratangense AMV1 TaxID=631454 RepID=V4TLA4_9HYPH|nr:hypothetical protein N177_0817 [Lutibaculum baratangense AMV1]
MNTMPFPVRRNGRASIASRLLWAGPAVLLTARARKTSRG